jgi:hypothetical protein
LPLRRFIWHMSTDFLQLASTNIIPVIACLIFIHVRELPEILTFTDCHFGHYMIYSYII